MISIVCILKFGQDNYFITFVYFFYIILKIFLFLWNLEELNLTQFVNIFLWGNSNVYTTHSYFCLYLLLIFLKRLCAKLFSGYFLGPILFFI